MTEEQQNIAIAKACGWSNIEVLGSGLDAWPHGKTGPGPLDPIPSYNSDLNAMHEAEATLNPRQREVYAMVLNGCDWLDLESDYTGWVENPALSAFLYAHSSAAQRAEAFLKTLGLWEGGE